MLSLIMRFLDYCDLLFRQAVELIDQRIYLPLKGADVGLGVGFFGGEDLVD